MTEKAKGGLSMELSERKKQIRMVVEKLYTDRRTRIPKPS